MYKVKKIVDSEMPLCHSNINKTINRDKDHAFPNRAIEEHHLWRS